MKKSSSLEISFLCFGAFLSLCVFLFFFELGKDTDFSPYLFKAVEASAESVIGDFSESEEIKPKEQKDQIDQKTFENLFLLSGLDYVPNVSEEPEAESEVLPENIAGKIVRKTYTYSPSDSYLLLADGGLLRNCTDVSDEYILEQAKKEFPSRISLNSNEPQVLILHTHTTECFEETESDYYTFDSPSRTQDTAKNVVAVGRVISDILNQGGVNTLHVTETFDYPEYSGAYDRSSEYVASVLQNYPSVKIVIDLHRDAIEHNGERIAPIAQINGKSAAQVMIICGNLNVPQYRYNLRLATKLQSIMENKYPTLARPLLFDERNYNQELSKGAFLLEVGSHANSLDEALYSGELVAECLLELFKEISE